MKKAGVVLVVAILALGYTPAREEEKGTGELKKLDARLTEAFKDHDIKTLEKYTADDYVAIDPLGRVHDRKQHFEHLAKGNAKIDEMKETNVKVRSFGTTAVVTGVLHLKGMVGDRDISGDYRWTRVYNKKDGEWQCVAEQHTFIQPKEKQ